MGTATEFEVDQEGIAHNSENLDDTREESIPHTENVEDDPGAGRSSRGLGRVSFLECLDKLGERLNPAIPATCTSGVSNVGNLPQMNPPQSSEVPLSLTFMCRILLTHKDSEGGMSCDTHLRHVQ